MAKPPPKKLRIVTADQTQGESILAPEFAGPAMKSDGDQDYVCGNCGTVLLESMAPENKVEVIIKCGKCHALNAADTGSA
jgi:hypothetical protein